MMPEVSSDGFAVPERIGFELRAGEKGCWVGGMKTKTFLLGLILGGFLASEAPAEKGADAVRGTLVFEKSATELNSMAHWDEYGWKYEAIRWGRYRVEVSYYGLKRAMGVQARLRTPLERLPL